MIGKIIYGILSVTTAVTDLVSTAIYPAIAPEEAGLPYVTYQLISQSHNRTKDRNIEKYTSRVQIDIIASTYDDATDIADAITNALAYYNGTAGGSNVEIILFDDQQDMGEVDHDTFRIQQDYKIIFAS